MAEIAVAQLDANAVRTVRWFWEALGDADTGSPVLVGGRPDGSIQVVGTFGSATATLQGSNDGTTWATLTDESGNDVEFTAAGLKMFLPRVWKIRISTSGGTGTDLDAYLLLGS